MSCFEKKNSNFRTANRLMRDFRDIFYQDIPCTVGVWCPSCQKLILRNCTAVKQFNLKLDIFIILLMKVLVFSSELRLCKNSIIAMLHSSCTQWELIDMKVEHVTLPVFESCHLFIIQLTRWIFLHCLLDMPL